MAPGGDCCGVALCGWHAVSAKRRQSVVMPLPPMTLIGHTGAGELLFSPGPGDTPCLVRVVNPNTLDMGEEIPLAYLPGQWGLAPPFDRDAWNILFASPAESRDAAIP